MTRLGWFECLVLVAFFFTALAAFLMGGMVWVGYVARRRFCGPRFSGWRGGCMSSIGRISSRIGSSRSSCASGSGGN